MREFSPDGFSWWDGTTWRPSTEIEVTPQTEFERSGKLAHARGLISKRDNAFAATYAVGIVPDVGLPVVDLLAIYMMGCCTSSRMLPVRPREPCLQPPLRRSG